MALLITSDRIGARSLGTGTAQTQLSGDRSGNATNYVVPAWCRAILSVRSDLAELTPTAAQSVTATLKIQSNDVNVGNYEILAEPLGSALGATAFQFGAEGMNGGTYPFNLPLNGGENLQFFGQAQVTNTVGPTMGATVWLSNTPVKEAQVFSLMSSKIQGSGPTSTGTAAGTVNIGTPAPTISGATGATLIAGFGAIGLTTIVASDKTQGFYQVQAPEVPVPIRWNVEPINGFLGATGQVSELISFITGLHMEVATPTSLQEALVLETAPANAGNFVMGVMYQ